uniref:neuropeptides B/W receptor type 1-like n=1 Tax=Styela clava TaxID=7725 RepID=UPI0019396EEB|nr:neuropeptides B/W receptor type 1-like [Styela clava]
MDNVTAISTMKSTILKWNLTTSAPNKVAFKIYEEYEAVAFIVVLLSFCAFGLFANSVTFTAIWKSPKLKSSVFNIFLMSLCVSDFVSAVDSLGVLYRRTWGFRYWNLPTVFCKLTLAVDLWTTIATIQHVLIFCVLRIISFKFPTKFGLIKPSHAKTLVAVIWVETFFFGFLPFFIFPAVKMPPSDLTKPYWYSCAMQQKWLRSAGMYAFIGFPILIYIPLLMVVVLCLLLIFFILQRRRSKILTQKNRSAAMQKERSALIQLGLIAFSFLLGYIPYSAYGLQSIIIRSKGGKLTAHLDWFLSLFCHTLLRFSECLNPVFYNIASSNIREATAKLLIDVFGLTGRRNGKVAAAPTPHKSKVTTITADQR